ncbi:MAG TPA: DNA polymerase domain-containing protein [Candidatus Thermoplasmatota archaeon]|nr:DNA polymerase domain-containing protein [Candidatus Thermoplasmatota archaeon]
MRVPLAAFARVVGDKQVLDLWTNSRLVRVEAPFLPYCYTKEPLQGVPFVSERKEKVRPLSTLREEEWYRYEFKATQGVSEANRLEARRPLGMADNHVAYTERVLIDDPEYYTKYANTDPLKVLYLDIEQYTTGKGFPTEKEPLISIAWARGNEEPQCILTGKDLNDRPILEALLREFREYDPDVIVGYNVDGYDLPMILRRLKYLGMDARPIARGERGPVYEEEDETLIIEGRIVYDVFDSVKMDQTLHGIKDLKLKTVAEWMKLPFIKEDTSDTASLVGTDRLREYNLSDVRLTRNLSNIYFKNFVALAEFYNAPLNLVFRATPTFHTTILQGRVFKRLGIVSDGKNGERFASLYSAADGQAFVGGIVEIYKRGLFQPVHKVDFSSMYPSIMVSLGCGADNTRLVKTEPYGPFLVTHDGEKRLYHIPDESRNLRLVVEIVGQSPMALELKRLLQMRLELKKKAKVTEDAEERERLHATQNVIKVVLNAVYGIMASPQARYGSLPVAVATVGIARRLIRVVEDHLGDGKIETDTDGVYSSVPVEGEAVNRLVAGFVERELGAENFMRVEVDRFKAGYFHEKKSYILLHDDGRLEKHGIAFKGSSLCGVFDKTLERVSRALLTGGADPVAVGRACFDLKAYEQQDFVMRIRLGKDPSEYASGNALGAQVARAAEKRLGVKPERGMQLEYIKTTYGYDVPTKETFAQLDTEYYKDLVKTVLERLDIPWQPTRQKTLAEWFG